MATRLTPLGLFGKWFMIPVVCAGVGFLIVGPRLGANALNRVAIPGLSKNLTDEKKSDSAESTPESEAATEAAPVRRRGPSIDVDVQPASPSLVAQATPERPRKKKRRRRTKPKAEVQTPTAAPVTAPAVAPTTEPVPAEPTKGAPPMDEGGSGGAATAGGTGAEPTTTGD